MKKHNYKVVVGNIGTVYEGTNGFNALHEYNYYVGQSQRNFGRAAGEPVTLFRDDEIHREYEGTLEDN